ncbi:MAG: 50S ribosomal protein L31 [Holosporales bacterium]|jgi:large subunit ribosomal protein L31|nr:50S ribosomal protein L31 [Holosporales bacterium]
MKKNIHPEYHSISVVLTNGEKFETKSTYGKDGEVINLDIDPMTHPAWTGTGKRLVDKAGQISKFGKRYNNFGIS